MITFPVKSNLMGDVNKIYVSVVRGNNKIIHGVVAAALSRCFGPRKRFLTMLHVEIVIRAHTLLCPDVASLKPETTVLSRIRVPRKSKWGVTCWRTSPGLFQRFYWRDISAIETAQTRKKHLLSDRSVAKISCNKKQMRAFRDNVANLTILLCEFTNVETRSKVLDRKVSIRAQQTKENLTIRPLREDHQETKQIDASLQ